MEVVFNHELLYASFVLCFILLLFDVFDIYRIYVLIAPLFR